MSPIRLRLSPLTRRWSFPWCFSISLQHLCRLWVWALWPLLSCLLLTPVLYQPAQCFLITFTNLSSDKTWDIFFCKQLVVCSINWCISTKKIYIFKDIQIQRLSSSLPASKIPKVSVICPDRPINYERRRARHLWLWVPVKVLLS